MQIEEPNAFADIPDPVRSEGRGARRADFGTGVRAPGTPGEVRATTQRRRSAAAALSLAWLVAHLTAQGLRADWHGLPGSYFVAQIMVPALLGCALLGLALAPGRFGLGAAVRVLASLALLGPISFWALAWWVHPRDAQDLDLSEFWSGVLGCFDVTVSSVAVPLLLAALALRQAFVAQANWRSALVGSALGLLSGAAINLHCSNMDAWHVTLGHGVPIVMALLCGAFWLVRWTRA